MSRLRSSSTSALWLLLSVGCGGAESPPPALPDAGQQSVDASVADAPDADAPDADASNASDGVSCDLREVRCRMAEPVCPPMQTAQVIGTCFGPCVPIDRCVCTQPEQCPHEETFVCHRYRQRCGPYVD